MKRASIILLICVLISNLAFTQEGEQSTPTPEQYRAMIAQSIVIAIDYKQPPENRYPSAVNDCYTALQWIYKNAGVIGGDPCRIGLIGDSSGGNLAAALCLKNREEDNAVPILIQVLINPVLDLRKNSSSFNTYMGCVFAYLNDMKESHQILASPLAAETFNQLPNALIITSENDESIDEAKQYHSRLINDGVASSLFEIQGVGHFAGMWAAGSDEVNEAKEIVSQQLLELF